MKIPILDAIFQTQIFIVVLITLLLTSIKKRQPFHFDQSLTEEMKGFGILAILFSHIGYFLVADDHFLWPLSVAAGVGVNLFLMLSGYGLTISSIKNPLKLKDFYLKRLLKLFIPLWIVLTCLVAIDGLFYHKIYSISYLIQSFAGIFLTSNPAYDIDSPLWYFTLIFFFYLIFPLIFRRVRALLSGVILLFLTWVLLQIPLPLHADNVYLYQLHFLAFPLGVILASMKDKFKLKINNFVQYSVLVGSIFVFSYFAIHSGVGEGEFKEQGISILCVMMILVIFLLKNFQFRLLNLIGKYSYEIYLIHWPIMFRLQNLYGILPGSLATIFYLMEFLILGLLLQKLSQKMAA